MLAERLRWVMENGGDVTAINFRGTDYAWTQIKDYARLVAELLEAADPDSRAVAFVLRNRPSGVATLLATMAADRCPVLITPIQPSLRLCNDIRALAPSLVIADREDWNADLEDAVRTAGGAGLEISEKDGALRIEPRSGLHRVEEGRRSEAPERASIVIPTSGTTGPPKRIPISEKWLSSIIPPDRQQIVSRNGVIAATPLVTFGGARMLLNCAVRPLPLILMERLDMHEWVELVALHKPKVAGLPPAGIRMLMDNEFPPEKFASVQHWHTGSAPMDPELHEAFEAKYGKPLICTYGATELGLVASWTVDTRIEFGHSKRGSSGRPAPGIQVRIVDEVSGSELKAGERGIIEVHSPNAPVPPKDFWVRTTDLGYLDEDGFLFIDGRADDVIIRGGFKVPLFELEAMIDQHPAVRHSAAVGLPDERLGKVPAAAIVLWENCADALTEAELITWLRERVPAYHVPTRIRFVDALPLNASMKVSRPDVLTMLSQ